MGRGIAKELQDASTALSNPGLTQQSWTHAAILDSLSNPGLAQQSWTHAAILDSPGDRRGRFFFFIDFFDKITM